MMKNIKIMELQLTQIMSKIHYIIIAIATQIKWAMIGDNFEPNHVWLNPKYLKLFREENKNAF